MIHLFGRIDRIDTIKLDRVVASGRDLDEVIMLKRLGRVCRFRNSLRRAADQVKPPR
ncbi:MAG: hypothetical protein QGG09_17090 [Pirellulaceae bacterium]|jgi:hypothetical protein|nr:hypothetical protein [Pirellulaceae bacterium]HJN13452.1 hypothetical protein [Pirellulaceae bacterium]